MAKYKNISGKNIGTGYDGIDRFKTNINENGMILALTGVSLVDQLLTMGYLPQNIIVTLSPGVDFAKDIEASMAKNITEFYIDEPIGQGIETFVHDVAEILSVKGGTLTISESYFAPFQWWFFRPITKIAKLAKLVKKLDGLPVFASMHSHYEYAWKIFLNPVQSHMKYLRKQLGSRFRSIWVNVVQTENEMIKLFNCATDLKLNRILFYPYVVLDYVPGNMADGFRAAAKTGWLESI